MLVGSNLCIAHPIMWERVSRNPNDPEIIVIDPRATETAMAATQHLAPAPEVRPRPCSTAWPVSSSSAERSTRTFVARRTPTGFDEFAALRRRLHPGAGRARRPGWRPSAIEHLARTIATGSRGLVLVDDGRQPEPPGRAHRAGDHQPGPDDRQHRPTRHRRQLDHRPVQRDGLAAVQQHHDAARRPRLRQRRRTGQGRRRPRHRRGPDPRPSRAGPTTRSSRASSPAQIRALWVVATNAAHSWINQAEPPRPARPARLPRRAGHVRRRPRRRELADLVLPAAGWGEKEGTFINSERRIGLIKRVARAPGEALADFPIFKAIADAWGCGEMFRELDRPRGGLRDPPGAHRRPPVRHHRHRGLRPHRHRRACSGRSLPAAPTPATRRTRPRRVGPDAHERRLFADGRFFTPDRSGPIRVRRAGAHARSSRPSATRSRCSPGAAQRASGTPRPGPAKSATLASVRPEGLWVEIHPDDAASRRSRDR